MMDTSELQPSIFTEALQRAVGKIRQLRIIAAAAGQRRSSQQGFQHRASTDLTHSLCDLVAGNTVQMSAVERKMMQELRRMPQKLHDSLTAMESHLNKRLDTMLSSKKHFAQ